MRLLLLILVLFLVTSFGDGGNDACADEAGPGPTIPKASGDSCVRDPVFMRSNHMEILKHRRDLSVREGDRARDDTAGESLKACITCHAVPGDDNRPVGFSSSKHFCRACHDYTAVRIDCFECHNSKPDKPLWSSWKSGHGSKAYAIAKSDEVKK